MAIFEQTPQTKTILDDTEKLSCTVENAQNVNKHTEYILRVQRGTNKESRWTVSRRYRDFAALHASLQAAHIDLPLPRKKLIGNMQPSFIAERQIALQTYINEVLKHQVLNLSLQVRSFLDPSNYSLSIGEQAVQTVSIALRGDGRYDLRGPMSDIGWRIRKHYFSVIDTQSRSECLLSYQMYGPDRSLGDKDLQTAFKCILGISHPHIDPVLAIHGLESGAYAVRKVHDNGSVRDMLYGTEYCKSHLAKYANPRARKPFTMGQIAHYGYQLLLALKFLHEKGLPHGHVHPGNLTIVNQKLLLLDVENFLIGGPCLYRPYLIELRKTSGMEAVDVYCFGRTLYEMAVAAPLDDFYCDIYPDEVSEYLIDVLQLCLSSSSARHGVPSLDHLLQHPFFMRTLNGLTRDDRHHLKVPLQVKEEIRRAVDLTEARLKREQKVMRSAKRETRIQEILNSEEELRKQRRRAKKRESIWKSMSSLGYTVPSHSASTASSPTPPALSSEMNGHSHVGPSAPSPASPAGGGRAALLDAICGFDKTRLARVDSH